MYWTCNQRGELHWSLYCYNTRCACPELRIVGIILLSHLLCRCLLSCVITLTMSITFVASTLATPVLDTLVSLLVSDGYCATVHRRNTGFGNWLYSVPVGELLTGVRLLLWQSYTERYTDRLSCISLIGSFDCPQAVGKLYNTTVGRR